MKKLHRLSNSLVVSIITLSIFLGSCLNDECSSNSYSRGKELFSNEYVFCHQVKMVENWPAQSLFAFTKMDDLILNDRLKHLLEDNTHNILENRLSGDYVNMLKCYIKQYKNTGYCAATIK